MDDLIEESQFQTSHLRSDSEASIKLSLEDFYRKLVIWGLICPSAERRFKKHSSSSSENVPVPQWREFLDQLCWLGDVDIGGSSVTSIAMENVSRGPRYWVASAHRPTQEVMNHLKLVLSILKLSLTATEDDRKVKEDEIVQKSMDISGKCVRQYIRWFTESIERDYEQEEPTTIMQLEKITSSSKEHETRKALAKEMVNDALRQFANLNGDRVQLCDRAYHFRRTRAMQQLHFLCEHEPASIRWALIRHRIGRLGSWRKAAKTLISTARDFPWLVQKFELRPIQTLAGHVSSASTHALNDELGVVVRQMHLELSPQQVHMVLQIRRDKEKTLPLIRKRLQSCFRAHVHAECVVAEYFFQNRMEFAGNDRYIGCSKPSCYCCNLYLKHHPGNFVSRPRHGNAWPQWLPPAGLDVEQSTRVIGVLNAMIREIDQDIDGQLVWKRKWKGKSPDSATNITTPTVTSAASVGSPTDLRHTR